MNNIKKFEDFDKINDISPIKESFGGPRKSLLNPRIDETIKELMNLKNILNDDAVIDEATTHQIDKIERIWNYLIHDRSLDQLSKLRRLSHKITGKERETFGQKVKRSVRNFN